MKTQFTPGPWFSNGQYIEDQHGTIAKVMRPEANAALIVAAPDMFEALEELLGYCEDIASEREEYPSGIDKARAALAKAKGEF